jgi:predicted ATPase
MGSGEAKPASQRKAPQGLYMYGGVGVGKTMLMDLLVTAAPPEFKVPEHLHSPRCMSLPAAERVCQQCASCDSEVAAAVLSMTL